MAQVLDIEDLLIISLLWNTGRRKFWSRNIESGVDPNKQQLNEAGHDRFQHSEYCISAQRKYKTTSVTC